MGFCIFVGCVVCGVSVFIVVVFECLVDYGDLGVVIV